ncbi:hypothetical protein HK096_003122 [Nowakowskiella sp. JEL0078]|nr:hypothetical protein HK096_003122 [Nowakowskiella sp. JEL0078]
MAKRSGAPVGAIATLEIPTQNTCASMGFGNGRGKSGKQLSALSVRHRKILRNNISGITKPAIRRLARRGGVRRISAKVYDKIRESLKIFLEDVLKNAILYTESRNAKTMVTMDIVYALKRRGNTLYAL